MASASPLGVALSFSPSEPRAAHAPCPCFRLLDSSLALLQIAFIMQGWHLNLADKLAPLDSSAHEISFHRPSFHQLFLDVSLNYLQPLWLVLVAIPVANALVANLCFLLRWRHCLVRHSCLSFVACLPSASLNLFSNHSFEKVCRIRWHHLILLLVLWLERNG